MLLHDTTAAIIESMNSKYVGIWKGQIKAYFKVLPMSSPWQTEENQENPHKDNRNLAENQNEYLQCYW
jgi:hypothetical protein